MKGRLHLKFGVALAMLMAFAAEFDGQTPGTLDLAFGTNGMVLTDIGNLRNEATSVVVQLDGKVIAAGTGSGFTLVRYNVDGSPDAGFGVGGVVTSVLTPYGESVGDLALQTDGKIVVAGANNNNTAGIHRFIVARYNPDGSLDTSFGPGGFATTVFGTGSHFALGLVIQSDGKIVAAGGAREGQGCCFSPSRAITWTVAPILLSAAMAELRPRLKVPSTVTSHIQSTWVPAGRSSPRDEPPQA